MEEALDLSSDRILNGMNECRNAPQCPAQTGSKDEQTVQGKIKKWVAGKYLRGKNHLNLVRMMLK